jgi:hypothetical protein
MVCYSLTGGEESLEFRLKSGRSSLGASDLEGVNVHHATVRTDVTLLLLLPVVSSYWYSTKIASMLPIASSQRLLSLPSNFPDFFLFLSAVVKWTEELL